MSLWLFVKLFGDVCLYFSVVSAFPYLFDYSYSFLWPALLCATGGGLAGFLVNAGRGKPRFLCLLLPLFALILAKGTIDYLVLLPALAYSLAMILRGDLELEYYTYRDFFRKSITVWCLFFTVICLLCYFENAADSLAGTLAFQTPLLCGLLYLLCGVLLLRQLRMGKDSGSRAAAMNGVQLAAVLGGTAVSLLGLVTVERLLSEQESSVIEVVQKTLISLATAPLIFLTQLISSLMHREFDTVHRPETEQTVYTEPPVEGGFPPPVLGTAPEQAAEHTFPWWAVVLILVAMLVVMLWMLRSFHKRSAAYQTEQITGKLVPPVRQKRSEHRTNRGKVRQAYRSFLKQEKGRGLCIRRNQTSADILAEVSSKTDAAAASRLRQIYLVARYSDDPITDEQARDARTAAKESNHV